MKKYIAIGLYLVPALAFAETLKNLKDVINLIMEYLGYMIPLLFSIAIVFFIVGIVKFFVGGEDKLPEAKQMALWGILALFVMVSVWGFVNILLNTFGFGNALPGLKPGASSSQNVQNGFSVTNSGAFQVTNSGDAYVGQSSGREPAAGAAFRGTTGSSDTERNQAVQDALKRSSSGSTNTGSGNVDTEAGVR